MREYRKLLRDVPFELVSLDDLRIPDEVEETGVTFEENARLKAETYGALAGILTLADDSGLEVDALGGEPGVFSSRYGEKFPLTPLYERGGQVAPPSSPMSDRDRVELLLRNLDGVPWERRTARFRCFLAVAKPSAAGFDQALTILVGSVAGMIQYEPQGGEGFGYDPVFFLPSYGKTMSQIPLIEKNHISHRADAARKAMNTLQEISAREQ